MFIKNTALIVPTRNRPKYLRNLLIQIKKINFNQIIIVDSSDKINKPYVKKICKKYSVELFDSFPSTSHQRNIGLNKAKKTNKFIMFVDDDIIFLKNSFKEMNKLINRYKNNSDIAGFGFNLIDNNANHHLNFLKKSWLAEELNLYSKKIGKVTKSGWHTKISNLKSDKFVDWIYTAAAVYKYNLIKNIKFDTFLGKYSYLEDLDFCLSLKKKMIICCKAKFIHPNDIERKNFNFGVTEITNRYIVVRKHKLNIISFFLGAFLRFFISFLLIFKKDFKFFFRSTGNVVGILKCLFQILFYRHSWKK
jgi:GT2 family glycosyltransferase